MREGESEGGGKKEVKRYKLHFHLSYSCLQLCFECCDFIPCVLEVELQHGALMLCPLVLLQGPLLGRLFSSQLHGNVCTPSKEGESNLADSILL